MSRKRIHIMPGKISDMDYEDIYEEINQDQSNSKVRKVQMRQWRALKQDMRGD